VREIDLFGFRPGQRELSAAEADGYYSGRWLFSPTVRRREAGGRMRREAAGGRRHAATEEKPDARNG
jgi:hypothetical protein